MSSPALPLRSSRSGSLRSCEQRHATSRRSWMAHNKVLATQLLLGQRARRRQPHDPKQWHLHAASTLLIGIVVRGAESRTTYKIAHTYLTPQHIVLPRMRWTGGRRRNRPDGHDFYRMLQMNVGERSIQALR